MKHGFYAIIIIEDIDTNKKSKKQFYDSNLNGLKRLVLDFKTNYSTIGNFIVKDIKFYQISQLDIKL